MSSLKEGIRYDKERKLMVAFDEGIRIDEGDICSTTSPSSSSSLLKKDRAVKMAGSPFFMGPLYADGQHLQI